MANEPETVVNRLKRELQRTRCAGHAELKRVEILTSALQAFDAPVPDYEPRFLHTRRATLLATELNRCAYSSPSNSRR
jgi:hypothetical protein